MKFFALFISLISTSTFAYVDLNLQYSLNKRVVEGSDDSLSQEDQGNATATTESTSVILAWYLWEYTALELNYTDQTERLIDDRVATTVDASITVLKTDSTVKTTISGVGLRQAFASRKSRIIPSLGLGVAKFVTSGETVYTISDGVNQEEITIAQDIQEINSSYASFILRFRITQFMGLTLAAKTVMPDYETSQAENNVTYSAGFSWIF